MGLLLSCALTWEASQPDVPAPPRCIMASGRTHGRSSTRRRSRRGHRNSQCRGIGRVSGGMVTWAGHLGVAGMAGRLVAMTNWPLLEADGEEGVGVTDVQGRGGGTYAVGCPEVAAPITLSVCGPRICANRAAHRCVTSSIGLFKASMPGTGGLPRQVYAAIRTRCQLFPGLHCLRSAPKLFP